MTDQNHISLFEGKQVRYLWDDEKQQYFFSVVDVIQVLTDSPRPRKYWNDLKTKLETEGSELSANIGQLKLPSSDGKKYLTDVAFSPISLIRPIRLTYKKHSPSVLPLVCHLI